MHVEGKVRRSNLIKSRVRVHGNVGYLKIQKLSKAVLLKIISMTLVILRIYDLEN